MFKKILFFIVSFYILTLLQTSLFLNFSLAGFLPNFVLLAVIFVNLFCLTSGEKMVVALIGGFYLDVFSLETKGGFFGFYLLISLGIFIVLKIISEKYVRLPVLGKI